MFLWDRKNQEPTLNCKIGSMQVSVITNSVCSFNNRLEQCFSTSGPQRPLSGPPNFSNFVSYVHNYYKFYKKPTLLAIKHQEKTK